MKLNLGVVDFPYATPPATEKNPDKVDPAHVSTGDVAVWLENRYHIMESFFHYHEEGIAKAVTESYEGAFENIIMGAPRPENMLAQAEQFIEVKFREFLSLGQIELMGIPGVPTTAAMRGVSHRFKNKRNPQGARPSFIDTGLYESAFKAWFEDVE